MQCKAQAEASERLIAHGASAVQFRRPVEPLTTTPLAPAALLTSGNSQGPWPPWPVTMPCDEGYSEQNSWFMRLAATGELRAARRVVVVKRPGATAPRRQACKLVRPHFNPLHALVGVQAGLNIPQKASLSRNLVAHTAQEMQKEWR
jgi:hypothetical protein